MKKTSIFNQNLRTVKGAIILASAMFCFNKANAQLPNSLGLTLSPPCSVDSMQFTPQIQVGGNSKIVIGGNGYNDGMICWNCYPDSNTINRANSFNMPGGLLVPGYTPDFSARISQDLYYGVMRFEVGEEDCYDSIAWIKSLIIRKDGSIGMGTDSTYGFRLAVNGGIACKDDMLITNTTINWPDYVFEATYNLKPLSVLEGEIKSLGHLPEMPSAEEVQKTGLSVSTVTATVVKKVEELTLYAIDQQKQLDELKKQNELLQKQNEELKKLLETLLKEKE